MVGAAKKSTVEASPTTFEGDAGASSSLVEAAVSKLPSLPELGWDTVPLAEWTA